MDLLIFYMMRPVMEYFCPIFQDSIPSYLNEDLENYRREPVMIYIQFYITQTPWWKRITIHCLIEDNFINYKRFEDNVSDDSNKLYQLLPSKNLSSQNIRKKNIFNVSLSRINRFKNSFIQCNVSLYHVKCSVIQPAGFNF